MSYEELWHSLLVSYDKREAQAVARWLLEVCFGLTMADILSGAVERLSAEKQQWLIEMQGRLMKGEPVQYVAGVADFGPRQFRVAPGVLIPRPETYELCQWVIEKAVSTWQSRPSQKTRTVLDVGTGSGCIACTLAAGLPDAEVTAWDVSPVALDIAKENAHKTGVDVKFEEHDMLAVQYDTDLERWDVIVSNPPYICNSEAADMEPRVLDHEPEIALFVPDDDPLRFFRHISNYAQSALREGGQLFFEINPRFDEHIKDILLGLGFSNIVVKEDQFGKNRFVGATWH